MRRSKKPITIASRRSRLARIQAELVGRALGRLHPKIEIRYHWVESEGDRLQSGSLAQIGGKGLFVREVERVVLDGEADLAVHSLKDLPAEDPAGLALAAVPKRWDLRDCLISRDGCASIADLPPGSVVGTSSPRRASQLLRLRPDLRIQPLRGNVETRLGKVLGEVDGQSCPVECDATLLAIAGLQRLGKRDMATHAIPVEQMMPAACQGALAIQCRADDHVTLTRCLPLNDPASSTAVHAERQMVAALEADCHSSLGVLAEPAEDRAKQARRNADAHWFRLRVRVLSADGRSCLEADEEIRTAELRHLVKRMAQQLNENGARMHLAAGGLPVTPLPEASSTPQPVEHVTLRAE